MSYWEFLLQGLPVLWGPFAVVFYLFLVTSALIVFSVFSYLELHTGRSIVGTVLAVIAIVNLFAIIGYVDYLGLGPGSWTPQ